jgi:hypothetical protein
MKSHGVSLLFVLLATFLFISSDSYALNVGGTNYEKCISTLSNYGYAKRSSTNRSTAMQRAQSDFNSNCVPKGFVYKNTHIKSFGLFGRTSYISYAYGSKQASMTNNNVAELKFINYKPFYQIGERLKLNIQAKIIKNRNQRVDLWISLQLPNGHILYMTPKITQLFSAKPQPFIKSIERIDETYPILHLQVPEGIGGNYTVSAIFIKEGKNFITDGPTIIKSNIAITEIVLSNR